MVLAALDTGGVARDRLERKGVVARPELGRVHDAIPDSNLAAVREYHYVVVSRGAGDGLKGGSRSAKSIKRSRCRLSASDSVSGCGGEVAGGAWGALFGGTPAGAPPLLERGVGREGLVIDSILRE